MKYYTTIQKPLSKANDIIPCNSISQVQSSLCPTLRHLVTHGVGYGVGFSSLEPEETINTFDKRDFTTLHKEHQKLSQWYEENKDTIEKVKKGDFSDYLPQEPKNKEPEKTE